MDIITLLRERSGDYDCPVCRQPLAECGLQLLHELGSQYTVQVSCASCRVRFLVVLEVRGRPETALAPRPPAAPPIGADEVLDVHTLLRDHQGPLTELFRTPVPPEGSG